MSRLFVSGQAGTGKTYSLRKKVEEDPAYGIVASTTGISAVNLGTVTVNSLLKYFDSASLADSFIAGRLTSILARLSREYEYLWIDEISMMDGEQLELIEQAILQVESYSSVPRPIKLGLTGDFAQLPPVKAKWAFQSSCWHKFAANTERLTKVWRQTDLKFLEAINLIRAGNGHDAADILKGIPEVKWTLNADPNFEGTTIIGLNKQVDNFNFVAHNKVQGEIHHAQNIKWGTTRSEWKNIPEAFEAKVGAYVMILANAESSGDGMDMEYANGDCGHVTKFEEREISEDETVPVFTVKLLRTDKEVLICPIQRRNTTTYLDDNLSESDYPPMDPDERFWPPIRRTYFDRRSKRDGGQVYVHGATEFVPLRLAYAATVHKTQGLSLDNCQIDIRGPFFGAPAMMYVALSRCRTPAGLTIVGTPELMGIRTCIAPEIKPWL